MLTGVNRGGCQSEAPCPQRFFLRTPGDWRSLPRGEHFVVLSSGYRVSAGLAFGVD